MLGVFGSLFSGSEQEIAKRYLQNSGLQLYEMPDSVLSPREQSIKNYTLHFHEALAQGAREGRVLRSATLTNSGYTIEWEK